ncbi:MAG: NB-ARC domain-containing protein [Aeromicrobium sp.]
MNELGQLCEKVRAAGLRMRQQPAAEATAIVVHGDGGFGKSTLVAAACRELRDDFPDGVLWVTVGVDPTEPQRIATCQDLARLLGMAAEFTTERAAASHLAQVLADRRALLVLDDVWHLSDIAWFMRGAPSVLRIVTTRVDDVVGVGSDAVRVGGFAVSEAESLLGWGLDASDVEWDELVRRSGRWPVLVRLINAAVRDEVLRNELTVDEAVAVVGAALAERGPTSFDARSSDDRRLAVRATVEVGIDRLVAHAGDRSRQRYLDLSVFPDDVDIPLDVLAAWWSIDGYEVRRFADDLVHLALVESYDARRRVVRLHDVVRDYLRAEVGPHTLVARHRALLAAHRPASGRWVDLADDSDYLWRRIGGHLIGAGLVDELDATVTDTAFLATKLHRLGAPAVLDDLVLGAERTEALWGWVRRWAHLVRDLPQPTDVAATLLARPLADDLLRAPPDGVPLGTHLRYAHGWSSPEPSSTALESVLGSHDRRVHDLAWSPDGRRVASTGGDGVLRIWSVDDASEPRTVAGPDGWIRSVAWSPDGRRLAYGDGEGAVWLTDPDGHDAPVELGRHGTWVRALAWSQDGIRLASASDDGGVRVWTVDDGRAPLALDQLDEWVTAMAWSPVRGELVTVGDRGLVCALMDGDEAAATTVDRHHGAASAVTWSSDGDLVFSAGDDGMRGTRVHARDGRHQRPVVTGEAIRSVRLSQDGSAIATGGDDGVVRVWPGDMNGTGRTLGRHDGPVLTVAWSPDSCRVVSGGGDGAIRMWRVEHGRQPHGEDLSRSGVRAVAWSPDGKWLAAGGRDQVVRLWRPDRPSEPSEVGHHDADVTAVAWSPDGRRLASGDAAGRLSLWRRDADGRAEQLLGGGPRIHAVSWSPDGHLLACAASDGVVRLMSNEGGRWSTTRLGGKWVLALAWSQHGRRLAASGIDGAVRVWDVSGASAPVEALIGQHGDTVRAVAWQPGGRSMSTGGGDGVVRAWPMSGGREISTELVRQGDEIVAIAWQTSGRLATIGKNDVVRVWTVGDRGRLTPTCSLGLAGSLVDLAWQPDGDRLAIASSSGLHVLEVAR